MLLCHMLADYPDSAAAKVGFRLKIEMVEFGYNYVSWYRNLLIVYRLWVGERPEPIIIFLTSCVPESQVDWPAINLKENISKMDLNVSSTLT